MPRTAARVEAGRIRNGAAHRERLAAGAACLGQAVPWLDGAWQDLEAWIARQAGDCALRASLDLEGGRLLARLEARPEVQGPWRLAVLPHPLGDQPGDPRNPHKGLRGPWARPLLDAARSRDAEDALLVWSAGTVAETCIAGVALETGGRLRLPPPTGRVASLAERLDLPDWAADRNLQLDQGAFSVGEAAAGRLWCFNALRGVWAATLLERP